MSDTAPTSAPAPASASSERGFALVMVIWIVAIVAVIAGAVLRTGRSELRLAHNIAEAISAEAATDGAIETAIHGLLDNSGKPDTWLADGTVYGWQDRQASFRVRATAEVGRVDLNAASSGLLRDLAVAAGIDDLEASEIAEAIVGFRATGAGVDVTGVSSGSGARSARGRFLTAEELLAVPGLDGDVYRRLAPYVTTYSRRRQPVSESALPTVRRAMHGDQFSAAPAKVVRDLPEKLANTPKIVANGVGAAGGASLVRIEAETTLASGRRVGRQAVVELTPTGLRPYRILAWGPGITALEGIDPHAP